MAITKLNGFYIFASTTEILQKALSKLRLKQVEEVKIKVGDILKFDRYGNITKSNFEFRSEYFDYFEYRRYKKSKSDTASSSEQNYKLNYFDDDYFEYLIQYAASVGYNKEIIIQLFEEGYDYMDIEEFLHDNSIRYEHYCNELDMYLEM